MNATANNYKKLALNIMEAFTMNNLFMQYRLVLIIFFHIFAVALSYYLSFEFRFDFTLPHDYLTLIVKTLPILILCRLTLFYYYKLFKGWWSYVGLSDALNIAQAVFFSSLAFIAAMVFTRGMDGIPRSVLLMDGILIFLFLSGSRVLLRLLHESTQSGIDSHKRKNVLIAGAGNAGVVLMNEIRKDHKIKLNPVGFVDDNPYKKGSIIQGLPVLGTSDDIPNIARRLDIDQVLICMPSAPWKDLHGIYDICKEANVKFRSLPSLSARVNGGGLINQLQDVPLNALLGRNTIRFRREEDINLLSKDITGQIVLITGAGGSIGSELARQTAQLHPASLILYERSENDLYYLEHDLRKTFPSQKILPIVGDILDEKQLDAVMLQYKPHLIYHAAAYKHVPMMERAPLEAVRNNILGTYLVATCAIKHHVPKFILISTDKAVKPTSIMGTTKRVAELVLMGLAGNGTRFIAVRFGNVMGSSGSVIPLFKKQIAEGGPITITHPEVSRYFMAISEAVQLVMVAGSMGKGGEIFLLDMGKPIKILNLAIDLIKYYGLEPGKDIDTVFTGLRPGEKMNEELFWEGEGTLPTSNKKITMRKGNGIDKDFIFSSIAGLQQHLEMLDEEGAIEILKKLVPEATIANHAK
jgi:FlaA1/EpsC-like NDP-sugar epimerase